MISGRRNTMADIKKKILDLAASQVGYKEKGTNVTKYAKYFDTPIKDGGAWQFFNTHKQGAEWCSLFVHWLFCQVIGQSETRKMFGEPSPKNNCAAGVKYFWNYAKAKGLQTKTPTAGDIIFFNSFGHVGIIEKVDSKIHTIEGNKSNSVKRCTYALTSTKISGFIRPKYPKTEEKPKTETKPKEEVKPADKKLVKATEPAESHDRYYARSYKVTTSGKILNMRNGAGTNYSVMVEIPNKATVQCYGYFTGSWLYVRYETSSKVYEGFCNKSYLK